MLILNLIMHCNITCSIFIYEQNLCYFQEDYKITAQQECIGLSIRRDFSFIRIYQLEWKFNIRYYSKNLKFLQKKKIYKNVYQRLKHISFHKYTVIWLENLRTYRNNRIFLLKLEIPYNHFQPHRACYCQHIDRYNGDACWNSYRFNRNAKPIRKPLSQSIHMLSK